MEGVKKMFETEGIGDDFHFRMLQEYFVLFQEIETETLSLASIEKLDHQVEQLSSLSLKEKELHHSFLSQFIEMNDKIKTLHWMSKHLKVLHDLGQTFSYTFDKEQIYRKAYELVSSVMETDAFVIALYKEGDSEIHIPFSIDNGISYDSLYLPFGEGIISNVIQTKRTVHIRSEDEAKKHAYVQWGNPEQNTQTSIFVPMILNNQIKGVISAQNYQQFAYRSEHEELLRIIGIQVASAIEAATLYDNVYEISVKDDLTHLKNSRKFHLDLEEKTKVSQNASEWSLIMLDSDNLKKVNDQFGHHVGDKMIQYVSQVLQMHLEQKEDAYRYAGDEFMIISPEMNAERLKAKIELIQEYLREHPFQYQGHEIITTVSIGVAQYPMDTTNGDELKRLADMAMYKSKENGKDRLTFYSELKTSKAIRTNV